MKNIVLFISLVLLMLINNSYAQNVSDINSIVGPVTIKDVRILTILNSDSSVSYEVIIGMEYIRLEDRWNDTVYLQDFYLPEDTDIDLSSISVEEMIREVSFGESVYQFSTCNNEYIYDPDKKMITICTRNATQSKVKIKARILPEMSIEACRVCEKFSNSFTIVLPPTNTSYYFSAKMEGATDVIVNESEADACNGANNTRKFSELKPYYLKNGIQCQGTILPAPYGGEINIRHFGYDKDKIDAKTRANFEQLQRDDIAASIKSSETAVGIFWANIVLLIINGVLVWVTWKNSSSLRWEKKRMQNAEMIRFVINPLIAQLESQINSLKENSFRKVEKICKLEPYYQYENVHMDLLSENEDLRNTMKNYTDIRIKIKTSEKGDEQLKTESSKLELVKASDAVLNSLKKIRVELRRNYKITVGETGVM